MQDLVNSISEFGTVIYASAKMLISNPYFDLAVIATIIGAIKGYSYR